MTFCFQSIQGHSRAVTACAFSEDGKYLASYSADEGKVNFWQVNVGGIHISLVLNHGFYGVAFLSPDPVADCLFSCGFQASQSFLGMGQSQIKCVKQIPAPQSWPVATPGGTAQVFKARLVWIAPKALTLMLPNGKEHRFSM